jgi:DNA polymerase IV
MLLYEAVRGIDPSPVLAVGETPPTVATGHGFATDTNDAGTLLTALYRLVEHAGHALRLRRRATQRVAVALDHSDGVRRVRQSAVRPASANDMTLFAAARKALFLAWTRRVRVRHLRLVCDRLAFPPAQLALFGDEQHDTEKRDRLIGAIDRLRLRFGWDAVTVGRTVEPVGPCTRLPVSRFDFSRVNG